MSTPGILILLPMAHATLTMLPIYWNEEIQQLSSKLPFLAGAEPLKSREN
jgi:hypothetical protein